MKLILSQYLPSTLDGMRWCFYGLVELNISLKLKYVDEKSGDNKLILKIKYIIQIVDNIFVNYLNSILYILWKNF